jgi:hypothetical protein
VRQVWSPLWSLQVENAVRDPTLGLRYEAGRRHELLRRCVGEAVHPFSRAIQTAPHGAVSLSRYARLMSDEVQGMCPPITRRTTMTHYLLSVHSVEGEARDPMTEEGRARGKIVITG